MNIPSTKPYFPKEDIKTILRDMETVLRSGRVFNGPFLAAFEKEFARACGTTYAVGLNSCTSALEIILRYYNVEKGEVIVPVNTFLATANAVLYAGGRPVLADIHTETLCLDPAALKRNITKKTKGVIVVHLAGLITPHIKEIRDICHRHNLFLVEDAAHAHGARALGKTAGSLGDAAAFSFYATKVLTSGGVGGALTTSSKKLDTFARSLRFHGEDKKRGIQDRLGNDWFLSEPQAVIGLSQIQRLPEILKKRSAVARAYNAAFKDLSSVSVFPVPLGFIHSYYKYPLFLKGSLRREQVSEELKKRGVSAGTSYWPPCHLQPVYKKMFGYKRGDFPIAESVLERTIALPMYTGMTKEEVAYVIDQVQFVCVFLNGNRTRVKQGIK